MVSVYSYVSVGIIQSVYVEEAQMVTLDDVRALSYVLHISQDLALT